MTIFIFQVSQSPWELLMTIKDILMYAIVKTITLWKSTKIKVRSVNGSPLSTPAHTPHP